MGYYYVLDELSPKEKIYLLEDLETGKRTSLKRISHAVFENEQQKKSFIIKILPADFKLSPFRCSNDRYLFKGENRCLLYNLSNSLQPFTEDSSLDKDSIVEFSAWE